MEYIVGTRGSRLALYQTDQVCRKLQGIDSGMKWNIRIVKTLGDRRQDLNLLENENKGVFCSDIEQALFNGGIDMAVHSIKDLPGSLPEGLAIAAYLEREDSREVLISREGLQLMELPCGARIGTSSVRRLIQLKNKRPDLIYLPIRGNVETRIRKVMAGEFEATVLALAGIRRLGMEKMVSEYFSPAEIIPAPGQGCIGVEIREKDIALKEFLKAVNHELTQYEVVAERAFLQRIGGNCKTAAGAYSQIVAGKLELLGLLGKADGRFQTASLSGGIDDAGMVGLKLAEKLLRARG